MANLKEKKKDGNALATVILIAFCGGVGVLMGLLDVFELPKDAGFPAFLTHFILELLLLFLSFYLQIIIHEAGHLIAGLLTGYRFSSFRIGSLMLLKNREGYSLKKYALPGTGGQCLLIPPEKSADGKYPYKLYHLGGILMNLITAALSFTVYFCFPENTGRFFLYLAICGVLSAVMNGVPIRAGGVATDGYNVLHIGKEPFALEAMWIQLKISEAQMNGIRLKELPEEWFTIPKNAEKHNEIISTIAVFSESRAMDEHNFAKAKEINAALEDGGEYSIIGLYESFLLLDKITIDLLENGADADISEWDSKQSMAFRKAMAGFPAVIRTEYAVALLKEKDSETAGYYRDSFSRVAQRYPMKGDIDAETEIMELLDACAEKDRLQS